MFQTLIYPSSEACDRAGWSCASACNTDTTQTQPHQIANTQQTENNTTDVVIQQQSRKLLTMAILMPETCWIHKKWNKIASDIKLIFYSSTIKLLSITITNYLRKFQIGCKSLDRIISLGTGFSGCILRALKHYYRFHKLLGIALRAGRLSVYQELSLSLSKKIINFHALTFHNSERNFVILGWMLMFLLCQYNCNIAVSVQLQYSISCHVESQNGHVAGNKSPG
jgi:hypothetical protein